MIKVPKKVDAMRIKITPIFIKEGVIRSAVFGSFAEGRETKQSDIDILVQLSPKKSLLDLSDLKIQLESKLGKKVDILTYDSIPHQLKNIIEKQKIEIYEKKF